MRDVEATVTLLVMAGTYVADRARPTAEADSVVDASPSSLRSPPPPRRTVLPSPAERNFPGRAPSHSYRCSRLPRCSCRALFSVAYIAERDRPLMSISCAALYSPDS